MFFDAFLARYDNLLRSVGSSLVVCYVTTESGEGIVKKIVILLFYLAASSGVFAEDSTEPWLVGYSTGLISGDGFSVSVPMGTARLQLVAGAQAISGTDWKYYSLGVNYKPSLAAFALSPDVVFRLYGVIGGSVFTGTNTNWVGYGMLYLPLLTSSIATYLLVSELENSPPAKTAQLTAGLGFGGELEVLKVFRLSVEPVIAGLDNLADGQFRGLRLGIQSSLHFDL